MIERLTDSKGVNDGKGHILTLTLTSTHTFLCKHAFVFEGAGLSGTDGTTVENNVDWAVGVRPTISVGDRWIIPGKERDSPSVTFK